MTLPRKGPLTPAVTRQMAAYLEKSAEELECSHYNPRFGRVTPAAIRREIDRCRRWATILRGSRGVLC